jgi:hypothetical protein
MDDRMGRDLQSLPFETRQDTEYSFLRVQLLPFCFLLAPEDPEEGSAGTLAPHLKKVLPCAQGYLHQTWRIYRRQSGFHVMLNAAMTFLSLFHASSFFSVLVAHKSASCFLESI